jgi:hypothetical protein
MPRTVTVSRPMTNPDDSKVEAVRRYLRHHFQALDLYDLYDPARATHLFRAYHAEPPLSYTAKISREFLQDHAPDDIGRLLEEWQLAEVMRGAGVHEVFVSNKGPKLAGG